MSRDQAMLMQQHFEENKELRARVEKLHIIAKNVGHALMSFTPGGSEYFTRVQVGDFEDYYADADVCQRRVRERITKAEEGVRDGYRAKKENEALRKALTDLCDAWESEDGGIFHGNVTKAHEAARAVLRVGLHAMPLQDRGWQDISTAPKDNSLVGRRFLFGLWDGTRFDWIVSGFFDAYGAPWHDGKSMQAFEIRMPTHFMAFDRWSIPPTAPMVAEDAISEGKK